MVILEVIKDLKTDTSSRVDGALVKVEAMEKEICECMERVKSAETHISSTEDSIASRLAPRK